MATDDSNEAAEAATTTTARPRNARKAAGAAKADAPAKVAATRAAPSRASGGPKSAGAKSAKSSRAKKAAPRKTAATRAAPSKAGVVDHVSASARGAASSIVAAVRKPGVVAALAMGAGAVLAAGATLALRRRAATGDGALASLLPAKADGMTEGHVAPDLAEGKAHPDADERAPLDFRPDAMASVPPGDRAAFAPALLKPDSPNQAANGLNAAAGEDQ